MGFSPHQNNWIEFTPSKPGYCYTNYIVMLYKSAPLDGTARHAANHSSIIGFFFFP